MQLPVPELYATHSQPEALHSDQQGPSCPSARLAMLQKSLHINTRTSCTSAHLGKGRPCERRHFVQVGRKQEEGGQARRPNGIALAGRERALQISTALLTKSVGSLAVWGRTMLC